MKLRERGQDEQCLPRPRTLPLQNNVRILAVVIFVALVGFSFRQGWTRAETDFPNYYTAALLVRKGEKLRNYYNWTWFQRQMNYAGIERQLGGYIPQTPLTMLPMLPIAGYSPQTAKRIWLAVNLIFLAATVWLLSRMTRFRKIEITLLALAGYGSLHINLLLGQYYIFLLFLLTLAFYCLHRDRPRSGGFLLGVAFALKLYGGPFILYFAAKRCWKAAAGVIAGSLCLGAVALALFGWSDIAYFGTHILPRALTGETLDPFNPGNGTISTLLRRMFMPEPELNPHPLFNAPWLFFFFRPFVTLAVLGFPLLALSRSAAAKGEFAWFLVALLLASPNTASYTFILLLLPVTLLMESAGRWKRIVLLACYVALTIPMRPSWNWLFPKVLFLVALFVLAGLGYWRRIHRKAALIGALIMIATATLLAERSLASYSREPGQHWRRVAVERGAIYSSSPAVLRSGIVYESIGTDRYVLRWRHGDRIEAFTFEGEALHPVALSPDGPIRFELVAHGRSATLLFNPGLTKPVEIAGAATSPSGASVISPNGEWIAFTSATAGTTQIYLRKIGEAKLTRLTSGDCNSFAPAWELDSKAILFASDCGRGIGLPSLYRAPLSGLADLL
jgi:hypothetical protein